ncbi:MAG: hypothetical protein M3384_15535, partial [Acidobacteriota bacterium]|nr:hypothetical protein [Acidobacteriota bacterium]
AEILALSNPPLLTRALLPQKSHKYEFAIVLGFALKRRKPAVNKGKTQNEESVSILRFAFFARFRLFYA